MEIKVNLTKEVNDSYPIFIRSGMLGGIGPYLKEHGIGRRYAIVTDSTVNGLYAHDLLGQLRRNGFDVAESVVFPSGEESKTWETAGKIGRELVSRGLDRESALIALGGGVVGDLTGFVASVYMRGIPYVQVPTTLLAQVDSSVGGKTGVDIPEGKNMLGTFWQPKVVFIDPDTLRTLPEREICSGLAEVVKYGMIWDSEFFGFLEGNMKRVKGLDSEVLERMIERSCKIKAEVVEMDERESGLRAILNYGHTLGHAIEAAGNYRTLHGEAVSLGMRAAAGISNKMGHLSKEDMERQNQLLEKAELPMEIQGIHGSDILGYLRSDKKAVGGRARFVLCRSIGNAFVADDVNEDIIVSVLDELAEQGNISDYRI